MFRVRPADNRRYYPDMPRLPDSRRRFAGISVLTILVVLAVLYALRRIPPNSPQDGREKPAESGGR